MWTVVLFRVGIIVMEWCGINMSWEHLLYWFVHVFFTIVDYRLRLLLYIYFRFHSLFKWTCLNRWNRSTIIILRSKNRTPSSLFTIIQITMTQSCCNINWSFMYNLTFIISILLLVKLNSSTFFVNTVLYLSLIVH